MITGATGFTGSFLVEEYARAGWRVHGTYREEPDDLDWLPEGVALHRVDLLDEAGVDALVREIRPSVAQHMAALSSVSASWREPMRVLAENASMQFHLLEALRRWSPGCRTLVAGSCDEYGWRQGTEPIAEGGPLLPVTPYALSKVAQDLMGYQHYHAYGLPVVRVRPFLQLGPRRASTFVAGSFARQIAEIELGLKSPELHVGNVDLRRDFTDVRDVARGCMAAATGGRAGEVYNIASGTAHTIREMLDIMLRAAGLEAEIVEREELKREGEPQIIVGNAEKLRRETGWEPIIPFERSAVDTLEYWRARVARSRVAQGEMA